MQLHSVSSAVVSLFLLLGSHSVGHAGDSHDHRAELGAVDVEISTSRDSYSQGSVVVGHVHVVGDHAIANAIVQVVIFDPSAVEGAESLLLLEDFPISLEAGVPAVVDFDLDAAEIGVFTVLAEVVAPGEGDDGDGGDDDAGARCKSRCWRATPGQRRACEARGDSEEECAARIAAFLERCSESCDDSQGDGAHGEGDGGDLEVLGSDFLKYGVRPVELEMVPENVLSAETCNIAIDQAMDDFEESIASGSPLRLDLGKINCFVRVERAQLFHPEEPILPELEDVTCYDGVLTNEAGEPIPGSMACFTLDPQTNRFYGICKELEDPNDPSSNLISLWVEPLAPHDSTASEQTHFVYSLADTIPDAALGPQGLHVDPLVEPDEDVDMLISGDVNVDGVLDVSDAVSWFQYLFFDPMELSPCLLEPGTTRLNATGALLSDWNGDGRSDISDGIASLGHQFLGQPSHVAGAACSRFPANGCGDLCVPSLSDGLIDANDQLQPDGGAAGATNRTLVVRIDAFLHQGERAGYVLALLNHWAAQVKSEIRNIQPREATTDTVTVASVIIRTRSLSTAGYADSSTCETVLDKFRDENRGQNNCINVLFTPFGEGCAGRAILGNGSRTSHHSIVLPVSTLAYEAIALLQEIGHNLDSHNNWSETDPNIPHDSHTSSQISDAWLHDHGFWIFYPPFLHCTAMRGGYGGCDEPEPRYHRYSTTPLRHLAEGLWKTFPPSRFDNLAFNRPTHASSTEVSQLFGDLATDGDLNTRWSSGRTDPQSIYVDLGFEQSISRVVLRWEVAYARAYQIQVWDSGLYRWVTVQSVTNGDGDVDSVSFSSRTARWVRMLGTERGTSYGYSLWEFEVFEE